MDKYAKSMLVAWSKKKGRARHAERVLFKVKLYYQG